MTARPAATTVRTEEALLVSLGVINLARWLSSNYYYTETFVPAQNISYAVVSPVIQKLGLRQPTGEHDRIYVLRSYFDNRIMSAESDKKIGVIYSWRQLWMGHSEGIEAVYTTNKTIPEDIIEQMRKAYAEASDAYLTLPKTRMVSIEEASNEFKRIYVV
jgi:hypothetical protein